MIPVFPDGEFYACDEPESLTCTDPWEAAEQYLDNLLDPKMTVAEVEAALSVPLTVTAYVPKKISDNEIKNWSENLLESLEETWRDEHGDPDGDHGFAPESEAIMLEAVTKIIRATRVWSCEESGHVDLTGEQVLEWARQENPDWFEPAPPSCGRGERQVSAIMKDALGPGWAHKLHIVAEKPRLRSRRDLTHRCRGCGRVRLRCAERVRRHGDSDVCITAECEACGWIGSAP